jgi:hypothetical protein
MRELLQAAETVVDEYKGVPSSHFHSLLVKLEEAIAAAKGRTSWVKFSDALPVVPDGYGYIFIWLYSKKKTIHRIQYPYPENPSFIVNAHTHWLYCQDDTPQPPRSEV